MITWGGFSSRSNPGRVTIQVSIRVDGDGNCRQCSVCQVSDRWTKPADFPAINPAFSGRENDYVYVGTTSGARRFLPHFPFDSVGKLNCSDGSVATWSAGRRRFVGEPIFVPRKGSAGGEDDGYILVVEVRNPTPPQSLDIPQTRSFIC